MSAAGSLAAGHPPARVLIVRLSSIGDIIHAMPAFMALREALPDAEIGWAVESAAASLVRRIPDLTRVHELDVQTWRGTLLRPTTWIAGRRAIAGIRDCHYDLAIDMQGLWKSAVLARLSGAQVLGMATTELRERGVRHLYQTQASPTPPGVHVIDRGLHLVATACPAVAATTRWPMLTTAADTEAIRGHVAGYAQAPILVHSAANWASKVYPEDRWAEVGQQLQALTGRPVVWLWGPGEGARATRIAAAAGAGNAACFRTELPHLAALMRHAAVVVGGDSAPLHLAVACGAPVVALFGPTDPARLGPTDPADRVVVRQLECSHCHRRVCPLGTNECLDSIGADEIVRAVIARLENCAGAEG